MSGRGGGAGQRLAARMVPDGWEPPQYARVKPRLLAPLAGEVVEIGPGAGINLGYYGPGVRWTGVEPNPHLHERIRRGAARAGLSARLIPGRAERIDAADSSVDAVVGTLVLCSVADADRVLAEVLRVLRPGGRYVFLEHVAAPPATRTRRAQDVLSPVLRRLPGGCRYNRETGAAIARAGFGAVEHDGFDLPVSFGLELPHIAGTAVK
ncbi:methyltransferase domain-containing protein [Streptomonospora sp. S1-112]|uniref:Methyltransferase domain-containing protein n=1 Tax=Streptomonospora mangrovi TaxID=2883123 RepID=A0A9X3NQA5_9ACTN|nr:class I SAM-dependent methyltransferase [Streptomonospora mangrovi]MDA0564770.1 methyltransferase domain-containing protein [Streptomonospora mangrovi]